MTKGTDIKHAVKKGVKLFVMATGRSLPPASTTRILTYHSVGDRVHDMTVRPEDFEAQLRWLSGYEQVISLEEAAEGKPGVAITFDDGFVDNLAHAAPVLHALTLPATLFMVAGRAGQYLLDEPDPRHGRLMDWDELHHWKSLGLTIGGHTLTHRRLSHLPMEEQRQEIVGCKDLLEKHLGIPITAFAYPYGAATDYTAETGRLVQEAGFHHAVSNRYGCVCRGKDRFVLRRIWVDASDSLALFQAKVNGRLDRLRWLDSGPGIWARRGMNALLRR